MSEQSERVGFTDQLGAEEIAARQLQETVVQELNGQTVRMALITCPCERRLALVSAYKCLYCNVWLCSCCAEEHFGKTVAKYRSENHLAPNTGVKQ